MTPRAHDKFVAEPLGAWSEAAFADLEAFCAAAGYETTRDEPLGRHTSMGVGGPTPLMFWPHHPDAVAAVLDWCACRGLAWRILGGGTNILVSDAGVAQPVVNLTRLSDGVQLEATRLTCPAGVPTAQALRMATRKGLGGLVWSTGLPGTIGGAAVGNAGCWGGAMADVVGRLDVVGTDGVYQSMQADALDWSYRRSGLEDRAGAGAVIVSVVLDLHPADREELEKQSEQLQQRKRERQPVGARNAGCVFKNPDAENPAGKLIDDAGCKGMRVGDAQISEMHGNFLVNRGRATTADVDELIESVKHAVAEQLGVALEEEIRRW